MALGARLVVRGGLDLRDLPGPGGVKIIAALTEGNPHRDRATELIAAVRPLFADAADASRAVCLAGGVLAVLGAALAARGLAGRTAALAAGALAAAWSQAVYVSLLIGADAVAMGLAWLGAGLALVAPRLGWAVVALAPAGLALAAAAVPVKVSAMPAVAAIAAAPFLVPRQRWRVGLGVGAALVVALVAARGVLLPGDAAHVGEVPTPTWAMISSGWARLRALPATHPEGLVLVQLPLAAVLGALLPGRGWPGRLVLGAVGALALGFTAETVGDKLRPRFLTAAALPLVVLAGCGLGVAVDLARAALARWLPRAHRPSRALVALVPLVALPLWQDTLAFHEAWARVRTAQLGTRVAALPGAPAAWRQHYSRLGNLTFVDTSDQGALDLVRLGAEAPAGGAATVPLRDAREFHLRAGAGLAGKPALILEARRCCPAGQPAAACAATLVTALDRAGMDLLIPVQVDRTLRVPRPHQDLWQALDRAATQAGGVAEAGPWWRVRAASGAGGPPPCGRNGR